MSNNIVKIIEVVDTREYEEVEDGVFKPIPGSGIERHCDRCNKLHTIHATVLLEDNTKRTMGISCAKGISSEQTFKAIQKSARNTQNLKKMKIHLAKINTEINRIEEIEKEVSSLPYPKVATYQETIFDREVTISKMENTTVWLTLTNNILTAERLSPLKNLWRKDKISAIWKEVTGHNYNYTNIYNLRYEKEQLEKKIARKEKQIKSYT